MKPLNGTKTHPLSDHARERLRMLVSGPMPSQCFNPGVVDRLLREDLARIVMLPSPYKKHKGADCPHLEITDTGRAAL